MLAAPPVPVEPLPPHRIALRAAVCGVAGSLAACVVALPLVLLSSSTDGDLLMFFAAASGLTMTAVFVAAVELVRRLPAAARLAGLVAFGVLAPAFVMATLIWLYFLSRGEGPEGAWRRIITWFGRALTSNFDDSIPAVIAMLIPFALVGAAHAGGWPRPLGRVLPFPARVVIAAVAGGTSLAIAWRAYMPWGREQPLFFGFLLTPPALEVAIALALRVEARLLTWWEKRREAA